MNFFKRDCAILLFILISVPVTSNAATKFYLLDIPWQETLILPNNAVAKTNLLVSIPTAAPGFDKRALVYFKQQYEVKYHNKAQWVDTPARMLLPLLVHHLELTGIFKAVLSASTSPIYAGLRLDTEIVRLQQEFFTEPSQVHLVFRAQLLDMNARQVLATRVFEITENARSEDAEGGMLATNRAVARLLKAITKFVEEHYEQNSSTK
jgi:cholesterol transport system auxiliary component